MLLGVFVALKAVAYWLDRYGLAVKSSDFKAADNWTGLRYVDANAYLPAKTILFCIAVICALLFFATLWRRTWQLPVIGFGLMVLSAILIGGLYPAIVQKFQVQPNEQAKEAPYIEKNIKATREAYGIDGRRGHASTRARPATDGRSRRCATTPTRRRASGCSTRTWSRRPSSSSSRCVKYYAFPTTLDVDRYKVKDGAEQDTVIGLRELNLAGIPKRNWINDHFKYTHGYGVVAAKGTEADRGRRPDVHRVGPAVQGAARRRTSSGSTTARRPRTYSIVGGPQKEIDYSDDSGEKTYSYRGKSGVNLSNPVNRAAYAVAFGEPQILYSGAIGEGSRILYNRTPKERVEAVAPWLTIDGDAYPAVIDGRIEWIVDALHHDATATRTPRAPRSATRTADSLTDQHSARWWPSRTRSTTSATRSRRPSTPTPAR